MDGELTRKLLSYFALTTNRSIDQTMMLYELCGKDFVKLTFLEEQLKNLFFFHCPSTVVDVDYILMQQALVTKTNYFLWRMEINNQTCVKFEKNGKYQYVAVPLHDGYRRDVIDGRPGKDWWYWYNTAMREPNTVEVHRIGGKIRILTEQLKMTTKYRIDCPICGMQQNATLYDSFGNGAVTSVKFNTCQHFVFDSKRVKQILEDQPHPEEKSKLDLKLAVWD